MAYGAKYRVEFGDIYDGIANQATIYKKDYSGIVYDMPTTGEPVTIQTDNNGDSSYRPIVGSIATINLTITDNELPVKWETVLTNWEDYLKVWNYEGFSMLEFLTAENDTFFLEIKRAGNVIWRGYYIPTSDVTLSEIRPFEFSLKFSDLSLLKSTFLYDTNSSTDLVAFYATDIISIKDLLVNSLYSANLFSEVRINFPYTVFKNNAEINGSGVKIDKYLGESDIYLLKNATLKSPGEYLSYYDVLYGICANFGLMMYQANGILYITSYEQLLNETSRVYKRYASSGGTYLGDITETDIDITLNTSTFRNIGQTQEVRYALPYKFLDFSTSAVAARNVYNGLMWGYKNTSGTWFLDGWSNITPAVDTNSNKVVYAPTAGTYSFGHKLSAISTVKNSSKYIELLNPPKVEVNDIICVSSKVKNDAVFVLDGGPTAFSELNVYVLWNVGSTVYSKYLQTNGTWADTPANVINLDFKNIKVPATGNLRMLLYYPWSSPATGAMYAEYVTAQVFKGSLSPDISIAKKTTSRSYYMNVFNNKETKEYNALGIFFNGAEYIVPGDTSSYDKSISNMVGNAFVTKYRDHIQDSEAGSPDSVQYKVGNAIQRNIGTVNTAIQGSFKFTQWYPLGTKFKYTVEGYEERSFIMLDQKISLKNSATDSILYSCEFITTAPGTFVNKPIKEY